MATFIDISLADAVLAARPPLIASPYQLSNRSPVCLAALGKALTPCMRITG